MHNYNAPTVFLKLLDGALICAAAFSSDLIVAAVGLGHRNVMAQLVLVLVCVLVFESGSKGLYKSWRAERIHLMLNAIFWRWLTAIAVGLALAYFSGFISAVDEKWMGIWSVLSLLFLFISRVLVYKSLRELRANGNNQKKICIISDNDLADSLQQKLESNPWLGYKVQKKALSFDEKTISECLDGCVEELWLSNGSLTDSNIQEILAELELAPLAVRLVPSHPILGVVFDQVEFVSGIPVINIHAPKHDVSEVIVKCLLDYVASIFALVIFSPVFLVVAILIKIESEGPVFFRQKRLGLNGRFLEVYKFRTMVVHESKTAVQAVKNDPRVTKIGSILRKSSLDELPQFLNVLKGDMSIVGPRPHPISLNDQFMNLIPKYMKRHLVKPGITGWAQINGYRGETDTVEKMRKRVEFDLYYIENWSIWLDIQIMIVTVFKGFFSKNAY